jgi:hypothetical protein
MCASNCGNCSTCAPDIKPGKRGPQGIPGPANTLTFSITALPPGSEPEVDVTGVSPNQNVAIGFPLAVPGTQGPTGPAGDNATELFTNLSSFTVPALNATATATVGDTSWMVQGAWVYIGTAGYFRVASVLSPTTVSLTNPGSSLGWPTGLPSQAAPLTVIASDATQTQVIHAAIPGIPGAAGAAGAPGATPQLFVNATTTIPVAAPADGGEIVLYYDNPTIPTIVAFYAWDGAAWNASPNLIGPEGTLWQTTNGDPNVTLPSGPVGTFVLRTDVLSIYQRVSPSTWTLVGSLTPTYDQVWTASSGLTTRPVYYTPDTETHTSGKFTMDLTRVLTVVDVQAAIELDYSTLTNYGEWWLELENSTAGALAVTYTAGEWEEATGVTTLTLLAASGSPGDRAILHIIASKGKLVITQVIIPVAI